MRGCAAEIGNVFAFRQLAVDLHIVNDRVVRILIHDALGALGEFLRILLGPPVFQIALCVELTAFVVEAVRQLVADGPNRCCRSSERRPSSDRTAAVAVRPQGS